MLQISASWRRKIAENIMPEPNSGCWIWLGNLTSEGYAKVYLRPSAQHATISLGHRLVYEVERGRIPSELELDHKCRVRCCVNPDHLEPVTQLVNWERGQSFSVVNARKTHCPQGHPYDGENLYQIPGKRGRFCRACNRKHAAAYKRRKTGSGI